MTRTENVRWQVETREKMERVYIKWVELTHRSHQSFSKSTVPWKEIAMPMQFGQLQSRCWNLHRWHETVWHAPRWNRRSFYVWEMWHWRLSVALLRLEWWQGGCKLDEGTSSCRFISGCVCSLIERCWMMAAASILDDMSHPVTYIPYL